MGRIACSPPPFISDILYKDGRIECLAIFFCCYVKVWPC